MTFHAMSNFKIQMSNQCQISNDETEQDLLSVQSRSFWESRGTGCSRSGACRPWNRTVEGPTSAVSEARDGEANEAEGICRSSAHGVYFELWHFFIAGMFASGGRMWVR